MKYLITAIAAVVLVGCGESDHQHSHDHGQSHAEGDHDHAASDGHDHDKELKAAETAKPEPPTAKAPDITIHEAAEGGNIEAVKQHLAAGTDVDAKGGWLGGTPLHYAVGKGHKKIVELLIAKGADVHEKAKDGTTPLHSATTKEIAELLITEGADVNPQSKIFGTPLDLAIQVKNTKTADLLRKHGGKTGEELKAEGN